MLITIDREKFAGAIRAHCRKVDGGQRAFASSLGIGPATITRATQATFLPSADNFVAICQAMGRKAEDFTIVSQKWIAKS